jgi:TPR repeat protein
MRRSVLFWLLAGLLLTALAGTTAHATDTAEEAYRRGDHAAAFAAWHARAERGDVVAQFNAAILLDQGRGVARDRDAAARLYRLAAAQGYARAAFNVAQMLAEGDGVERDAAAAANWYRAAAEAGDMLAQFDLGLLLAEGRDGLRPDPAAAARWFARAAAQDHPQALFRLGTMFANGTGVAQDLARATELFERADVALMSDESNTSCTTQRSALRLAQCRRAVPRM